MLLDKLESGILALETDHGPVYVQPSGWQRLYLLWTFRHFNNLPLQTLNSRQRRLVERLPRCNSRTAGHTLDRSHVIGTVEGARLPAEAARPENPAVKSSISQLSFQPVPSREEAVRIRPAFPIKLTSEMRSKAHAAKPATKKNPIRKDAAKIRPSRPTKKLSLRFSDSAIATMAVAAIIAVWSWHGTKQPQPAPSGLIVAVPQILPSQVNPAASTKPDDVAPATEPLLSASQTSIQNVAAPSAGVPVQTQQPLQLAADASVVSRASNAAAASVEKAVKNPIKNAAKSEPLLAGVSAAIPLQTVVRLQISGPPRKMVYPSYPETNVRGKVELRAVIAPDGRVREVKTLSGNRVLSAAAARAVRQWRYEPHFESGGQVERETTIAVLFVASDVVSVSFPPPAATLQ